jgi:hypothetical protein
MGNLLIVNMEAYKQSKNRSRHFSTTKKHFGLKRMNFSKTVIGLHVCYNQEILVNNAADHKQICVIYETVYFCIGGGVSGAI